MTHYTLHIFISLFTLTHFISFAKFGKEKLETFFIHSNIFGFIRNDDFVTRETEGKNEMYDSLYHSSIILLLHIFFFSCSSWNAIGSMLLDSRCRLGDGPPVCLKC